jgi:hypothetical protein
MGRAQGSQRLVGRPAGLPSPQPCDRTRGLLRQAATRTPAGAVAGKLARQERARGLAGAPGRSRHGPVAAAACAIACVDTGREDADRRVLGTGVIPARGEAEHVVALGPVAMAHGGTRRRDRKAVSLHREQVDVL